MQNVVGMDMEFEFPKNLNIHLVNDGTKGIEEICKELAGQIGLEGRSKNV